MPYTVVRKTTKSASEFEDDEAKLVGIELLNQGVPLDRMPRVPHSKLQPLWSVVRCPLLPNVGPFRLLAPWPLATDH